MSDNIYKKLVNALFKLSGGQAMPTHNYVALGAGISTCTATFDGYLKTYLKTIGTNAPWFNIAIYGGISTNLAPVNFVNAISCVCIPVRKGDTINFQTSECEIGDVQLFKLVGGGLTTFCCWLKRGFGEVAYV